MASSSAATTISVAAGMVATGAVATDMVAMGVVTTGAVVAATEAAGLDTAAISALEDLAFDFPDELEAKAFVLFHVWDNSEKGWPIGSKMTVDALARQVFKVTT